MLKADDHQRLLDRCQGTEVSRKLQRWTQGGHKRNDDDNDDEEDSGVGSGVLKRLPTDRQTAVIL
jgi:hypothetical protein